MRAVEVTSSFTVDPIFFFLTQEAEALFSKLPVTLQALNQIFISKYKGLDPGFPANKSVQIILLPKSFILLAATSNNKVSGPAN